MKKKIKIIVLFLVVCILAFMGNIRATDLVSDFDNLFATGTFTINTDVDIQDDIGLYTAVSNTINQYGTSEYWNSSSDYSRLSLSLQTCDNTTMKCNITLMRNRAVDGNYTNDIVKSYDNITISVNTNIATYFNMVDNSNNININYDEDMFTSESEKSQYISNYINSLQSSTSNSSTYYMYNSIAKVLIRVDKENSNISFVAGKKINDVVFDYTETEFSDDFKTLTTGTLTIKSDVDITSNIVGSYISDIRLNNSSLYFTTDGNIVNNKIFIKLVDFSSGKNIEKEKHLISIVKDANINTSLFNRVGYGTSANIAAPEPSSNKTYYIMEYFNTTNYSYNSDNYYETFDESYNSNDNTVNVIYKKRDNNWNIIDFEIHNIPVNFVGYSSTISDEFKNKIGTEVTVRADEINSTTINDATNYNGRVLACNSENTYCDIAYFNYENNTIEIHNVKVILDNTISDTFKQLFKLKDDDSIDFIVDGDRLPMSYSSYSYYYSDNNNNSLDYRCDYNKCNLTYRNYRLNVSETHTINYNIVTSNPSDYYKSRVLSSITVYPGDNNNVFNQLSYRNNKFVKTGNEYDLSVTKCDTTASTCSISLRNENGIIEVHDVQIIQKTGKSPEYASVFPDETIKINAIYKDDPNYVDYVSMAYLMSTTKVYSYLRNYSNGTADLVFDELETHSVNVEFVEGNDNHKNIVDNIIDRIGNETISVALDDVDFVNKFYYDGSGYALVSNLNTKKIYDLLSEKINNKHVNYFLVTNGCGGGPYMSSCSAKVALFYDGIAYGFLSGNVELGIRRIIYIPDNTEETKEAYIAAAQKRIDDYLGENSGVVISFEDTLENIGDTECLDYLNITNSDGNSYRITYGKQATNTLIVKDSSKMQTGSFNAVDVNNNIVISSDNANYPSNTIVSSEKVESLTKEYKNLLNKLGVDNYTIFDINLFSPTKGDIKSFSNVDFTVSLPIDLSKFKSEKLYAYYIDGDNIEEHPITLDDFIASFKTGHFSTYVISEKINYSEGNPNTGDNIAIYVAMFIISTFGIISTGLYTKKKGII